jgi:hypothetical protein
MDHYVQSPTIKTLELNGRMTGSKVPNKKYISRCRYIGARETWLWALLIVSIAYWANIVRGDSPGDPTRFGSMIERVLNNGAFDVFAWMLMFVRVSKISCREPVSLHQTIITLLLGVIVLAPVRIAAAVALFVLGIFMLIDRGSKAAQEVGLVALALAIVTVWTSSLLAPLHVLVGGVDASIGAVLFGWLGQQATSYANVLENIGEGFGIAIWPYCSSSMPIASVSLAFILIVLYRGATLRVSHLAWVGMSIVSSILLTHMRLLLMASNVTSYLWWHDGPGVTIYALLALGSAVAFPMLATSADGGVTGQGAIRPLA